MTRTMLKGSYRAKQRKTQNYSLWRKLNKEREFSKTQGYALAFLILLGLGIPFAIWTFGYSPYFHEQTHNPQCYPAGYLADSRCDPPTQSVLWRDDFHQTNDITEWNSVNAAYTTNTAIGTSNPGMYLTPTNVQTAVALTKNSIDLSSVGSKELWVGMQWDAKNGGTCCGPVGYEWGWFLRTNSTLPTENGWLPQNDKAVNLIFLLRNGSPNSNAYIQILRTQGDTIGGEDRGCGGQNSCYIAQAATGISNPLTNEQTAYLSALNFTGASATSTDCTSTSFTGPSCSYITAIQSLHASTGILPPLSLTTQYYIGFFADFGNRFSGSFNPTWLFSTGSLSSEVSMFAYLFIPTPAVVVNVPPNIDTGGFFGPIIRALISIGVFIASNIISFFSYLYGLIVPILAGLATILGAFLVTILNAFGNIFGDNHLGTDINTAFTQITNYFVQVFSSAASIWGNILTTLLNFVTFITKFFGTNPFITFIENFIAQAPNIWTVFNGVWADIMKYYISGVFTIQTVLIFWYLYGMYEVYMHGVKGFKDWLHTSELGFFGIFKAGYWLIDEAYGFVVQLKQLLFGNTVSPVKVAGTG